MANENAILNENEEYSEDSFDFDNLEERLESQLEEELSELAFLESEKEKIGNPDELGKIILDEVWKQFGNQIGLDMTNETLIQKYDREHPEQYDEVSKSVMQDQRYKDANKAMQEKKEAGILKDEYTGKDIKPNENANLDHVVSRKEIFENQRRKQANLSTEELANKSENLKPTNESLNKSKGAKSVDEYLKTRAEREKILKEQNEMANKKIDESNMSDTEKRLLKEKNNKRLQDKLDADDELMRKADKEARRAINKDIAINATKEIGKKAGKDALKAMAISALFSLLKKVMNGLISFLKSQTKSFKSFLDEMKESIKSFFTEIVDVLQTGASTLVGTILSEIFGPIVSLFKKLASLIKQGVSSIIDAVKYLNDKENKNKPFSVKVAQVGKIITAGIIGGGAIFLGELFEKILLTVPGMQIQLPLIGTLANVIGMFLASLVSGLVGAIVINFIDKFIANRQKSDILIEQVDKGNKILVTQQKVIDLKERKLYNEKQQFAATIKERHVEAANYIKESLNDIFENTEAQDHREDFDEMDASLDELLD
jgi:hypothetical protein